MAMTFNKDTNTANIKQQENKYNTKSISQLNNQKPIDFNFGNNSFSGADMVAVMSIPNVEGVKGTYVLGSLQTLTYSTHMQRSPIRSIGNINAKDYVMGPRTIAGSLVFAVFDKHFAYAAMEEIKGSNDGYHFLADEIPPFDITITMANEYGVKAKLALYGVRLVNEGQVMSVNDIYTENTYQFVAHDLDYLSNQNKNAGGSLIYEQPLHRPGYITDNIEIKEEDIQINVPEEDTTALINVLVDTIDSKKTASEVVPGKAKITLDRKVADGTLIVTMTENEYIIKSQEINKDSHWPYICILSKGNYTAHYESSSGVKSNVTSFTINEITYKEKRPSPPIQIFEDKLANGTSTVAVKIIDNIGTGIRYGRSSSTGSPSNWIEAKVQNKIAFIENLEEYATYYFESYNSSISSESLKIYIDGVINSLFSDFYNHINTNAHKIESLTYAAFEKIWSEALAISKQYKVYSVAGALQQAKEKNATEKTSMYYVFYINEALKLAKEIADFKNIALTLKTPVLIDIPTSTIEFSKGVRRLRVTGDHVAPRIVESNYFIDKGDKCQYRLSGKAGCYTVTAISSDNDRESGPLEVIVYTQKETEDLIANKVTAEQLAESNKETILAGNGNWIKDKELNQQEQNNIAEEKLNDTKIIKEGIAQPVILDMTDKLVTVNVQIPSTRFKKYFLCISTSSNISKTELHRKISITEKTQLVYLYNSKYGLIPGERYSLWIENDMSDIVTQTTSFCYLLDNNPQSNVKDMQTAKDIKNLYTSDFNKNQVDSYLEDTFNPITTLDGILKSNCKLENSHEEKGTAILDAANAKHKYINSTPFIQKKNKIIIDFKRGIITDIKSKIYIQVRFDWYATHGGEQCNNADCYVTNGENSFIFVNRYIQDDTLAACVYLKDESGNNATEIIVVDFVSRQVYSKIQTEVIFP